MCDDNPVSRRGMIAAGATAAATMLTAGALAAADAEGPAVKNGRINHSVCLWCYKMSAAEMAPIAKKLGLKAIDLVVPKDFAALKEHGLVSSMTSGVWGGITKGYNRKDHHE